MTAVLTIARRAVWQAIDNYPLSQDAFRTHLRGDREYASPGRVAGTDGPTAKMELPAIEVAPASAELDWITNQLQQNEYALAVTIWTAGWEWSQTEDLWERVYKAVMLAQPPGVTSPKTYISRPLNEGGTGHKPRILPSRFTRTRIGDADNERDRPKVLAHTFGVAVRLNLQGATA